MDEVGYLVNSIKKAKQEESEAKRTRLALEERLCGLIDIKKTGTTKIEAHGHTVKIVSRESHSIDAAMLEEIAAENNLEQHLATFFRWKPEINKKVWDNADEKQRLPFTQAITTKTGKPSVSITETIEV